MLAELFDGIIATGVHAVGINGAIDRIQPGSDQGNKEEQSENEHDIDGDSDTQIDWPESLPASPQNVNLEQEIDNHSRVSTGDSTEITPLPKPTKKSKNATLRSKEKNTNSRTTTDDTTPNSKKKKNPNGMQAHLEKAFLMKIRGNE